MTSATCPTSSQVKPVKSSCCTVYKLDLSSSKFSDTSSSFLDFSLESSVSENEAEDSDEETAEAECKNSDSQRRKTPKAKYNGKSNLASKTKSLKQKMEELSLWVISDEEAKNVELSKLWLIHEENSFLSCIRWTKKCGS